MNNAQYFHNNSVRASAHYFVDENSVVQSVRDSDGAWHCGGSLESSHHPLHGICMNRNSLGVEMCSDKVNGKFIITAQTVDRTVELVKMLMAKYNIDADHVVRHYDVTGKDCPEPWVRDESQWKSFKARLTAKEAPKEEKPMTDEEFTAYLRPLSGDQGHTAAARLCKGRLAGSDRRRYYGRYQAAESADARTACGDFTAFRSAREGREVMGLGAFIKAAAGAALAASAAAKASGGSSSGSSSGSSGSSGSLSASGKNGSYAIGSNKGKNFVSSAAAGSTMTGSDGSTWKKNSDGSTTITKNGSTWTYGSASGTGSGGSSSGKTSGGGSSSGSSGGTYTPAGTYNDALIRQNDAQQAAEIDAIKKRYEEAKAIGDVAGMKKAHADAEAKRKEWGYSGGSDGSDYIASGGISGANLGTLMSNQYNQGFQDYEKKMNDAAQAQQSALQASVDSAVANLNAQKYTIGKNTEANNAAAEKAYMTAINPNGSMAENLAAQGLLTTGNTESSQISAGNTYQNALNSNATTATEALAEIERAITQARLNGDIQKANALADLYKEVAGKQLDNVNSIISAMQWGQQFGLSQAEQTGTYNGTQTLAMRQLQMQLEQLEEDKLNGKIDRETAQKQMEYIQAQIEKMRAETTGQNLSNKYSQWQLNQLG